MRATGIERNVWLSDIQPSPYSEQLGAGFRRLRFSQGLEREYRIHLLIESFALKRITLVFALLVWLTFTLLDLLLIEQPILGWMLSVRLLVMAALLVCAAFILRGVRLSQHLPLSVFGVLALGIGTVAMIPIGRLHDPGYPYEGVLLASVAMYFLLGLHLVEAACCSLAVFAAYVAVEMLAGLPAAQLASHLMFLLAANLIGALGCYLLEYKSREDFLLRNLMRLLADHDSLTGLHNRRSFHRQFERLWRQGKRTGQPLALLLCDIDHFKAYNDRYGHQAGDAALQQVGALITSMTRRPLDLGVRLGGEEFALLLFDIDAQQALKRAECLCQALREQGIEHLGSSTAAVLTLSVGVACVIPHEEGSFEQLYERADGLLYQAKASGRDRAVG